VITSFELNLAHRRWHETNRTYSFSHGLGAVIITIGVLIVLHPLLPQVAATGSLLRLRLGYLLSEIQLTAPEMTPLVTAELRNRKE
jgi:reactive chlorine resistance protein C